MKKWSVMFSVDATVTVEVEAETKEQARGLAQAMVETPSICHQYSKQMEVGEVMEILEVIEV